MSTVKYTNDTESFGEVVRLCGEVVRFWGWWWLYMGNRCGGNVATVRLGEISVYEVKGFSIWLWMAASCGLGYKVYK